MKWPWTEQPRYEAIALDEEDTTRPNAAPGRANARKWLWRVVVTTSLAIVVLGAVLLISSTLLSSSSPTSSEQQTANDKTSATKTSCPRRREWRTLSPAERQSYSAAVLCLLDQPSILAPHSDLTAYDDFPYIHSHVGYKTHHSASFLPWHRYLLHVYEQTLRSQCGYTGGLVYWDWTLDSEALERSPVFDADTGFGGDGEVDGQITVGRTGRCLIDGPFAGVQAKFYDVQRRPHCLSRGFRDLEGNLGHLDGQDISPESIEEVLDTENYEDFVDLMESRVHDAIPFGIGGDFETFTAPYGT